MMEDDAVSAADPFKELAPINSTPVAPAHGIAAIALSMALKFHDINTVQDGVLYQQYKMEGKNLPGLHLDHVFETAMRMEAYLMGASERIAKMVIDCVQDAIIEVDEDEPEEKTPEVPNGNQGDAG